MSKRLGLPVTLKMRHDAHYVESLTSYSGASIGRMIPVEQIRPNPEQPRKALGDLRELTESVREKGVLEPLLVRFVPREDCFYCDEPRIVVVRENQQAGDRGEA